MKKTVIGDEAISGVNIIPVIDVTLVLLVILLLMSPVLNLPGLQVNLPEAMTKETKDQNITVSLTPDGEVAIDQDIIAWKDLGYKLRSKLAERDDSVVIIRADKTLSYGHVESLIRQVNRYAGNHAIAIATKQRTIPLETKK